MQDSIVFPSFMDRMQFNRRDPLDDPVFKRSWESVIDWSTESKFHSKIRKPHEQVEDNYYFHSGLNLDRVFSRKHITVKYINFNDFNVTEKVPQYNFVGMLESVFHKTDLLSNNMFINPRIMEQLQKVKQSVKKVRFSFTEIESKHLPNCRRFLLNSEYGFLHSPKCKNHLSEKELSPEDFQRRANFLCSNLKPERFQHEFYYQISIEK